MEIVKAVKATQSLLKKNPYMSTFEIQKRLEMKGLQVDGRTIGGMRRSLVYQIGKTISRFAA